MLPGLDLENLVLVETHYRETVLFPILAQRAAWARWRQTDRANTGATTREDETKREDETMARRRGRLGWR